MEDKQFFESLIKMGNDVVNKWDMSSISVGIIKDGEVVFQQGFGKRDIKNKLDANEETLYQIGSCTKAFASCIVAMLCDKGLLDLNTPIRQYVPEIRLYDEFANKECTLTDLLSHRTGLPRHEFGWYYTDYTRQEMMENMKYYEPNADFRTVFQYCNFGFVLAGYICERVTGKTWEQLVQEMIFDKLDMKRSTLYLSDMESDKNHGVPYGRPTGSMMNGQEEIPFYKDSHENKEKNIGTALGPAGSINSCVSDMLKWVNFHLNNGKVNDEQVVSEAMMKQMHKPQMLRRDPLDMPNNYTDFMSYGLGWFTETYRGHKFIHHGGNINGFSAFTGFVPDLNLGVVAYTNLDHNMAHYSIARTIIDHYLGVDDMNWIDAYYDFVKARSTAEDNAFKVYVGEKIENTKPSCPLEAYAGTYARDGYRPLVITYEEGKLFVHYIGEKVELEHYHYDTFVCKGDKMIAQGFPIFFETDFKNQIKAVSAPLVTEPNAALIKFSK